MIRFRIFSESSQGERQLLFQLHADNEEVGREEALRSYVVHAKRGAEQVKDGLGWHHIILDEEKVK